MCHLRTGAGGGSRPDRHAPQHDYLPLKSFSFAASFTCRLALPLGLPHQQRASNVQRARGDEETADEKPFGGAGDTGGAWRYSIALSDQQLSHCQQRAVADMLRAEKKS